MSDGLLELLVLGKIPGTEVYIDYITSLVIGTVLVVGFVSYLSFRSYRNTVKRLARYSREKLVSLKTI